MYLAPNLFVAALKDRCIVLDLDRDRYVGLGRGLSRATLLFIREGSAVDANDPRLSAARDGLRAKGLLTDERPRADTPMPPMPPTADSTLWPSDRYDDRWPPLGAFVSPLRSLLTANHSLHQRPFKMTIARMRDEKAKCRVRSEPASLQALVDTFYAARPWFPVKPICRLDAMGLCLHLWRNGQLADLVFGVRLQPFAAHCWVQHDRTVLNEPHDRVTAYTPIMSI